MGVTSWATCLLREEVGRFSSHFSFFFTENFAYSLTEASSPINSTLHNSIWKAYIYTTIEHEDIQEIVPKYMRTRKRLHNQANNKTNLIIYHFIFSLAWESLFRGSLTWNTKSMNVVQKFLPLEVISQFLSERALKR